MPPLRLHLSCTGGRFHLEIGNTSAEPIRIWSVSYSSGYEAFSFQLTDRDGKTVSIRRKPQIWTVNIPASVEIRPGGAHVETLDLRDGSWDLRAMHVDAAADVDIAAVLEVAPDDHTAEHPVVTGRFVSNTLRLKWSEIAA